MNKTFTKITSVILILAMMLSSVSVMSYADEKIQESQKIRIYSSLDQSRHDLDVTIHNNKVFVDAEQLARLYDGDIIAVTFSDSGYNFIEDATDVNNAMVNAIEKNYNSDIEYFIMRNNLVEQQLNFDTKTLKWKHLDVAIKNDIEMSTLSGVSSPIIYNERVYVELLPMAKFLGAIVNVTKDKDGLSFYIPQISARTVIRDADYFVSGKRGFTLKVDDNTLHKTGLFFDVFLDCVSGELGSFVVGEYDANHFKNVILTMAADKTTPNYVEEIWEGYDYTVDFLNTDVGTQFIDIASDGYSDYIDLLNSNPEIKEMMDSSNKVAETGVNMANAVMGSIIDLYSYNYRIMQLATGKMETINNVYVKNNKYMFDESVSAWGRSVEDIATSIVNDYYNGLSGDDVLNALVQNSADLVIDSLLGSDGLSALMGVTTSQVATLSSITPAAALTYCGIMLKAFEEYTGYEYGSLKEVDTIFEMQTHLRAAFYTALNDISNDGYFDKEKIKFLNDCAKLYCELYLVYRGNLNGVIDEYLEVYNRINSCNIADAVMNNISNRDWLSKVKSSEIFDLVFVESSTNVDFHKLKEILGYPFGKGVTYGNMNAVVDFDNDGYPEIHIDLPDDRYHLNDACVIMDIDDGILDISYGNHTGSFYYDQTARTYVFKTESWWANNSQKIEEFSRWNGEFFEDYFGAEYTNNYNPSYVFNHEGLGSYEGKKYYDNIISTYNTEYDISTHTDLKTGDDIINYYNKFMKDIENSVKYINKYIGVGDDRFYPDSKYKEYVDYCYFRYNQDRSILEVTAGKSAAQHLVENFSDVEYWENQVPPKAYYIDTNNYQIIEEFFCDPFDDSWVDWQLGNGFEAEYIEW